MSSPPLVEVVILYDGEDITADCVLAETSFTSRANGFPGEARVVVKDNLQTMSFTNGKTLELFIDGRREWDGYVIQRKHNYWFEGHTANCYPCPHITPRKHTLIGADRNILFTRRVLYNKADPVEAGDRQWPAGSWDDDVIAASITDYLDDVDGLDLTTKVERIDSIDPWAPFRVPGPTSTFGMMMREIAQATGAVFFIDPDRYLIYTDVNSPDAPFSLTDNPTEVDEVGYREFTLFMSADEMINDALIWGAGQGSANIAFARETSASSVATHGRWQNTGGFRTEVWNQGSVERIANSIVYGSPASRRGHKDDKVSVDCVVWEPGLRVAQKVEVRSNLHTYVDVVPIREITMTFPTPDHVKYQIGLSHELDEPWSIIEPWRPPSPLRPFPTQEPSCSPYIYVPSTTNANAAIPANTLKMYPSHKSQQGIVGSFVAIVSGDGFPPNKQIYEGDNNYEVLGASNASGLIRVRYTYIWDDYLWYTFGNAGIQKFGGRILQWENWYRLIGGRWDDNTSNMMVFYSADLHIEMSGSQAYREVGITGLPGLGPGHLGSTAAPAHRVVVGFARADGAPLPARMTFGSAAERAGTNNVLWEGTMSPGEEVDVSVEWYMQEFEYCYLLVTFDEGEPEEESRGWLTGVQADVQVSNFLAKKGTLTQYHIPENMDGQPCVQVPVGGTRCEDAVQMTETVFRVRNPYILRTTRVTVDGLTLRNGPDYTESEPNRGEITFASPPLTQPHVCYESSGYPTQLPPAETLFILPVEGPITGTFGPRGWLWPPYYWHGQYYPHFHNGVDFGVSVGTPVYAAAAGTVTHEDQAAGGTMIHIYHPFHGFRTTYAHLSVRFADAGETVSQGQIIGLSGASGEVTGPHLHWGLVYIGSPEDPLPYTVE